MEEQTYDKIVGVDIENEMKDSYIDYAMSVIVARALPDVRDGLKPVHRRILYAMSELNLDPTKGFRKSAKITGDTMGKYHPHGNSSIYDAMARMAQDFSIRYPLVDGHGNFGSIDGDEPAAERYTEARLTRLSIELLNDIEKDTVDYIPNYDGTEKEPTVLPSRFPNLLVNGSSGIAVGMATNIPPHNLTEVIDGVLQLINDEMEGNDTDIDTLISIITGPDFPTGGAIIGTAGIKEAYYTGRGKIRLRAKASIEPLTADREQIVVTEIPYQVNKARMVERIADLVKDKKIEGISDISDISNRNGIRVIIELKKDVNSNVVLNQLYKYSQMEESFGVIMLSLVDNEPKVLNLKEMLVYYIDHQKEVVTRRTKFELAKAEKRAHILEGLLKALDFIDEVISIIRSSKNITEAKGRLAEQYEFSEAQSQAIVDLRLRALTSLEKDKLDQEFSELTELIKELIFILESKQRLLEVIKEELLIIRTKYGDERRTVLMPADNEIVLEDLIDEEPMVITLTGLDYIKRTSLSTYKSQNRGGKGIIGMQTRDADYIKNMFIASTHDTILMFTTKGKVYRKKTYEIPEAGRTARGTAVVNLVELSEGERISSLIPVSSFDEGKFFVMVTKMGIIKKTLAAGFANIRKGGLIALNLRDDDELISVQETFGSQNILIATRLGMTVMFNETDARALGRTATGVRAIRLNAGDTVVSCLIPDETGKIVSVTSNGFGKCTTISEFKIQNRGGKGLKSHKITQKTGSVIDVRLVYEDEELMLITSEGIIIRLRVNEINTVGRITQGVKLINLSDGVEVVAVEKISKEDIYSGESDSEDAAEYITEDVTEETTDDVVEEAAEAANTADLSNDENTVDTSNNE